MLLTSWISDTYYIYTKLLSCSKRFHNAAAQHTWFEIPIKSTNINDMSQFSSQRSKKTKFTKQCFTDPSCQREIMTERQCGHTAQAFQDQYWCFCQNLQKQKIRCKEMLRNYSPGFHPFSSSFKKPIQCSFHFTNTFQSPTSSWDALIFPAISQTSVWAHQNFSLQTAPNELSALSGAVILW